MCLFGSLCVRLVWLFGCLNCLFACVVRVIVVLRLCVCVVCLFVTLVNAFVCLFVCVFGFVLR